MNPLLNNNGGNTLPPQLQQNVQNVKDLMRMLQSGPQQIVMQNPMVSQLNQIAQMYKGQNMQAVFMNMCRSSGVDPNAILNELQR